MSLGKDPEYKLLKRFITLEAFLVQVIIYLLIWLWDDYLATILSLVLGSIALSLYLLSYLVELVDKSSVPWVYYRLMLLCFLAPLIGAILGILLKNGLSWL